MGKKFKKKNLKAEYAGHSNLLVGVATSHAISPSMARERDRLGDEQYETIARTQTHTPVKYTVSAAPHTRASSWIRAPRLPPPTGCDFKVKCTIILVINGRLKNCE